MENNAMKSIDTRGQRIRHKRMNINSAVLLMRGIDSWTTELRDISATGCLVDRPDGFGARIGDHFVLDMVIGDEVTLYMEAQVARLTATSVGFAYSRIPEDKQVPLWNLLGGYADTLETYDDE
jgi:hypothetical protein